MREYRITAKNVKNPIYPAPIVMGGELGGHDAQGRTLEIGNYYLKLGGQPFFAISGEAHFARMNPERWEDEILKMKAGGVNIISTYIFWIHHEEQEGVFDWSGSKDLGRFVRLCRKCGMYVILRIGPFSHGECRNGGFPDWLYGRPFDIRCDDPEYLALTERFYRQIYAQVEGEMFGEGGPVIGIQLENEHEHASCPWEMTSENSREWVPSGRDGIHHMATLKKMAMDIGFRVPLYTATAWGGACSPIETVFPLWGGYAFRPWMFYDGKLKEHPATGEFLYGDFHNNEAPDYYNFDPEYPAEDFPYACCEMGGGMNVYYQYRFQLPFESVGAIAQVKAGNGCNFLGYYMYHGGTNPAGKTLPYLNECDVPKFSYDYQAALGEFGQVRKSYHLLKLQHYLYTEFAPEMTAAKTFLSEEAKVQIPEDVETLRYVARVDESGSGFLFLNNYQDHVECIDQTDVVVTVETDRGAVRIPETGTMDLAKDAYGILPIWFSMNDVMLKYATAQPVTRMKQSDADVYLFCRVPGMKSEFLFEGAQDIQDLGGCQVEISESRTRIACEDNSSFSFTDPTGRKVVVCLLSVEESLRLWQTDDGGCREWFLSDVPVYYKDGRRNMEFAFNSENRLSVCSAAGQAPDTVIVCAGEEKKTLAFDGRLAGIFTTYEPCEIRKSLEPQVKNCDTVNEEGDGVLKRPVVGSPVSSTKVINARTIVRVTPEDFEGTKQLILQIHYDGDIGYAFIGGRMIHDNFANGAVWEIDLTPYKDRVLAQGLYIYIAPRKEGVIIDSHSAMAARQELIAEQHAEIYSISLRAVGDATL